MSAAWAAGPAVCRQRQLDYQEQKSTMTLVQGLEEYYRANSGSVFRPDDLSQESRELFRSHDMCHVIFGLDTNLTDEVMADTRTLLSCDVGVRHYARHWLRAPEAKELYREIGFARALLAMVLAVPRIVRAVVENRRRKKSWPWRPTVSELHRPIGELRSEYGIRVI